MQYHLIHHDLYYAKHRLNIQNYGKILFSELVVPATAMRLAQWAGRAIRTEDDQAHVYCYDKRLTRTSYGQRLLSGLPPFTLVRRPAI